MTAISPFASSPDALRISPDQARAFIEKLAPVFDQLRTVQPLDVDSLGSGAVVGAEAPAAAAGINRWIGAIQSAAGRAVQRSAALDATIQRARQVGLPIDPLEYLRSTTYFALTVCPARRSLRELRSGSARRTTIFGLKAVAVWLVARRGLDLPGVKIAVLLYAVQLAFNVGWSAVFFTLPDPDSAP